MTGLVDTHCHLQDAKFDGDRGQVLARSLEKLAWLVVVGDDLESSRAACDMVRERVFATVGYHPYSAKDFDDAALQSLRALAGRPGVRAIGEIGLDYYNVFSPKPEQHTAFERQLELARELGLPVVVHNRDADEDAYAILRNHIGNLAGCVMHCFGSDAAFAKRCVELGCFVSFAGNLTFPKADRLRGAAQAVPIDRLLVETDAPYLAPQAQRGKRCEPHFVTHTAELLARLKGLSSEALAEETTANAARLYAIE